jgi:hypothetical protein
MSRSSNKVGWIAPSGHQGLDRRAAQGGRPVQFRGLEIVADAGLGEHAPVTHDGDVAEPEPVLELGHLAGQGGRVTGAALEHPGRHRDVGRVGSALRA